METKGGRGHHNPGAESQSNSFLEKRSYLMSRKKPVQDILTETGPGTNLYDLTFSLPPNFLLGFLTSCDQRKPEVSRVHQRSPCRWAFRQKAGWRRVERKGRRENGVYLADGLGDIWWAGLFTPAPPIPLISVLLISPNRFRAQQLGTEFLKFVCPRKSKNLYILFYHGLPSSKFKKEPGFEH